MRWTEVFVIVYKEKMKENVFKIDAPTFSMAIVTKFSSKGGSDRGKD